MIGPRLGSLFILYRLWRRRSPADKVELRSAWRDMLSNLRDHTELVVGGDLKRDVVGRLALIELANIENVTKDRQS